MLTNLINNYLVKNENGERVMYLHKLGTSHKEAIERFVMNDEKYIIETHIFNNKPELRMIINPKRNIGERDAITFSQFVRVLIFYGLIEHKEIEKYNSFQNLTSLIAKGEEVKFTVLALNKELFLTMPHLIAPNISNQILNGNDVIKENAKTFLASLVLIKIFTLEELEYTVQNLEIILKKYDFKLKGIDPKEKESSLDTFITEINRFNKGPFGTDKNLYLNILDKIQLPNGGE